MSMDAKRAGLVALVEAYKVRVRGATLPSDDVLLGSVLQQIGYPHGAESLAATLDDVPGSVQLKPSELIDLLQKAFEVDSLKQRLKASEAEADEALKGIYDAHRIMKDARHGTPGERQSMALKRLGLLRGPKGKGRLNPKYQEAADHYFFLRTGGHTFVSGQLTRIEKLSHEQAIKVVSDKACLSWETLVRMWKKNKIDVCFNAPIFDDPPEA